MSDNSILPWYQIKRIPLTQLHHDFSLLFDELSKHQLTSTASQPLLLNPATDLEETDREIVLHMELPGIEERELSIDLNNYVLTIKGEKKINRTQTEKTYHLSERSSGSFKKTVQLPRYIDEEKVSAAFRNGVLTVTVPKSQESKNRERRIAISSSENQV